MTGSRCVQQDLKHSLRDLDRRMEKMRRRALAVIEQDAELRPRFALLLSMPGIGEISALNLLGELALLAPGLTVRQWVAQVDSIPPITNQAPPCISAHASAAPVTVTCAAPSTCLPWLRCATIPVSRLLPGLLARHKAKLQALIAVARKMLHAIFGMFRWRTAYDGSRLFPALELAIAAQEKGFPAPFQREKTA